MFTALAFLLGVFITYLVMRCEIKDLKADKEMVLNFNEKLIRDHDEINPRYELEAKSYIRHLDSHRCVYVPEEEEWPSIVEMKQGHNR